MATDRWQQIKEIFHSALEREPAERSAYLARVCAGDESLRKEVESLIAAHEKDGSFIDSPAYEVAADLVAGGQDELSKGQTFGHYEILSQLGKGGMGEVYLAEDRRLGRKVAVKLLPTAFTKDQGRLRRFEQEARAASALNHPSILTIYEIGETDGLHFISTEFIEGETLRETLVRRAMKINEVLSVAEQVASALAAAHKAGIVHRDIKPENIMVREDGIAKVLDFGLAKLAKQQTTSPDATTRALVKTDAGVVMGTSVYMSPEQARGLEVDARTDIWSLGVVLYEMLAGQAPFKGQTTSDVIAAVLEREPPPLARYSKDVPEALEWIVTKALTKEKEDRYQTAREIWTDLRRLKQRLDVEAEIERTATPEDGQTKLAERAAEAQGTAETEAARTSEVQPMHTTASAQPLWDKIKRNRLSAALMLASLLIIVGSIIWVATFFSRRAATEPEVKPASATSPIVLRTTQITSSPGLDSNPALSPDGNSIAYASDQNGNFEIYVKPLTPGGREIQLTSDGQQNLQPAWSPDGQRIAYYSRGRGGIWVAPALGGTAKQLTEFGARPAWSHDGSMIAFQSAAPPEPVGGRNALPPSTIWIISSQGGAARQVTQQGNPPGGHGAPAWSPDGKRIVFDAGDFINSSLWSVSVEGGELKKISDSYSDNAIYAPDGKDIYYTSAGLWKIHISPTGEPAGEPVQVAGADLTAIRHPTISADGKRIAYSVETRISNLWSIPLAPGSAAATGPPVPFTRDRSMRNNLARFSPDGQKIAFSRWRAGMSADIWMADADGRNATQLTANPATDTQPSWFPEGDRIAFLSDRNSNHMALWSIALASGKEELLLDLGEGVEYAALSPDGKQVAFNSKRSGTINIWTAAVNGGEAQQLTFDNELMGFPCWSPDGKFLAFEMKRGDDAHLAIIPSGGGAPTQLTFDPGQSYSHSWSPDGEKIAFAGLRNGYWNIYWVSRDGKTQKQLTSYAKLNAYVRYPAWSPLGNQIVYEYVETTGNIWLLELK
jgi:Tol biopolymer transport system component